MELTYKPQLQIGPICLGMSRADARQILGRQWTEFKKNEFSQSTTDAYDELGIYIYYDVHDIVKGVETFPESKLAINGLQLFGKGLREISVLLGGLGFQSEETSSGINFLNGSLRFYAPDYDENADAKVESIYVVFP